MAEAVVQPKRNRVMEAVIYQLAINARAKEAIIYLLAITASETVTVLVQPAWGIVCHAIVLAAVVVHSALVGDDSRRHLVLSLALVPLVRIISLGMPLVNIPQILWYPIIYASLLVAATKKVAVSAGLSKEVTFRISEDVASTYSVNIDGLSGSFVVRPLAISESEPASTLTPPATDTPLPAKPVNWPVVYGVIAALVAMGALLFFLVRRSHTKSSS